MYIKDAFFLGDLFSKANPELKAHKYMFTDGRTC